MAVHGHPEQSPGITLRNTSRASHDKMPMASVHVCDAPASPII